MSPDRDAIALDEPKHRAGAEPAYAAARVAGPLVTAVFPLIVAAIAVGVWQTLGMALGLGRDGVTIELEITIPLVVLLLVIPFLDRAGVYRSPLAISVGIVIVPTLALFLLSRLSSLPSLLHVAPASWLIGLQVFRVAGGAAWLVALLSRELRKPQFSIEAGILDVLVGLTAVPTALLVARGSPYATGIGIVWNAVGLFDFLLAIGLARIPGAGPGHMLITRTPALLALRPAVLGIVALGVPLAIILHVLSLWQLVAH